MPNKSWLKAGLLTATVVAAGLPGLAGPGEVGGPITVGDGPVAVAVDSANKLVYVANRIEGTVTQVNVDPNLIVKPKTPITVGAQPSGLAVNPVNGKVYVANSGSDTVSVISGGAVSATIGVGVAPAGVAVDPDVSAAPGNQSRIYVANSGSKTVTVIDGETDTIVTTINVIGKFPAGIGVDTNLHRVYVAARDSNVVAMINGATDVVEDFLGVGSSPVAIAIDSVSGRAYVANKGSDNVSFIDTVTNSVFKTLQIPPPPVDPTATASAPVGVAVDPDTSAAPGAQAILYVTSQPDAVWAYDITEEEFYDTNPLNDVGEDPMRLANNPGAMAFDAVSKLAYLVHVDDDLMTAVGMDTVAPDGQALTPQGSVLVGTDPLPVPGIGLNQIFGTATDDLSGIRFVLIRYGSATMETQATVSCTDAARHNCTWKATVPINATGPTNAHITIIDRGGNSRALPPLQMVII